MKNSKQTKPKKDFEAENKKLRKTLSEQRKLFKEVSDELAEIVWGATKLEIENKKLNKELSVLNSLLLKNVGKKPFRKHRKTL